MKLKTSRHIWRQCLFLHLFRIMCSLFFSYLGGLAWFLVPHKTIQLLVLPNPNFVMDPIWERGRFMIQWMKRVVNAFRFSLKKCKNLNFSSIVIPSFIRLPAYRTYLCFTRCQYLNGNSEGDKKLYSSRYFFFTKFWASTATKKANWNFQVATINCGYTSLQLSTSATSS